VSLVHKFSAETVVIFGHCFDKLHQLWLFTFWKRRIVG